MPQVHNEFIRVTSAMNMAVMGNADKIVRAGELRLDGNEWFKKGLHARAVRRYSGALNLISLDQGYSLGSDAPSGARGSSAS